MLILDVEKQTGLDRATIRFYEKEEIIIPSRSENGYRSYSEADVRLLLKVKLLRQLGVNLSKIKKLQQGSEEFSEVLTEQIGILESQIQEDTVAKNVCQQIQKDGAQYTDLDSLHYLNMLSAPVLSGGNTFSERVDRESHPWRRYFARDLDYRIIAALLNMIFIVILRIRPLNSTTLDILGYTAYFAAVPILAAMLHYFGTTPGKWAMGIRLESIHGGKLSGGESLYREGKIIWHGLGLFIPILNVWRGYRSYRDEKEGKPQAWNEDTEIIYEEWSVLKKCIAVLIFIVSFSLSLYAGFDSIMPTYRGEGIAINEFAENYRDYEKIFFHENEYIMADNGKWQKNEHYVIEETLETIRPEFIYNLDENGNILTIYYENSSKSAYPKYILPEYCNIAICAAVGSRPGSSFKDITKIDELLETQWYSKLPQNGGETKGSFQIADVTVNWETNIENCKFITHGSLFAEDDSVLTYDLKLEIKFGE